MWASKKENKIKNSFKIRARSADWWRRTAHGMEETSPDTKGTLFCPYDRVSQILRPHRLTARGQRPRPGSMYWGRAGRPIRFRSVNGCCTVLLLLLLSHTHTWCVLVHINFLRKVGIDLCSAISDPSSSFPANPHRMASTQYICILWTSSQYKRAAMDLTPSPPSRPVCTPLRIPSSLPPQRT